MKTGILIIRNEISHNRPAKFYYDVFLMALMARHKQIPYYCGGIVSYIKFRESRRGCSSIICSVKDIKNGSMLVSKLTITPNHYISIMRHVEKTAPVKHYFYYEIFIQKWGYVRYNLYGNKLENDYLLKQELYYHSNYHLVCKVHHLNDEIAKLTIRIL